MIPTDRTQKKRISADTAGISPNIEKALQYVNFSSKFGTDEKKLPKPTHSQGSGDQSRSEGSSDGLTVLATTAHMKPGLDVPY